MALTAKQKKFLEVWFSSGHVPSAAEAAGYSQRKDGYALLKRDQDGEYLRRDVGVYLESLAVRKVLPMSTAKPARPPSPKQIGEPKEAEEIPEGGPTIDWLLEQMSRVVADPFASANAKSNASREIRSLLEQRGNVGADPTKGVEILRKKMLPHARNLLPEHYQGDLDLKK